MLGAMKLFKRLDSPEAPWYCHFQVRGRRYLWSTKTADAFLARKRARNYREAAIAENFGLVDGMKARGGAITFQKLIDAYLELPAPEAKTKAVNVSGLKRLLKANGMSVATTIDRLGVEMALKWQQVAKAEQVPVATINGILRRARSLFSRNCMLLYRVKPSEESVKGFFSVPALRAGERRIELPTAAADATAHAGLVGDPEKAGMLRAYLMAKYAGMRAGEIKAARKDWIEGTTIYIGGREFTAKSKRWRPVALPEAVVPILLAGDGDYIVGDSRQHLVEHELPAYLRGCGFPKAKPLHSLRRQFGSAVFKAEGSLAARDALGHSSVAVGEAAYFKTANMAAPIAYAPPVT